MYCKIRFMRPRIYIPSHVYKFAQKSYFRIGQGEGLDTGFAPNVNFMSISLVNTKSKKKISEV